ncbi:uncharacterized protein LOC111692555 [Anoplophora glabripennis]|uniref:uncharacterized protein LOC111692555 n=1 Tax=Anoplophora glabripennis TaxID=217634 RepID=UPI000C793FF6|nr:uncharacterized protein LOC111692555 [Anoplophora glabripennis]
MGALSTTVRKYKKKTSRGEWSKESMKQAVEKVLNKEMGYRKAALQYSVPQTTLERHVNAIKTKGEMNLDLPLGPITTVFSKKEENELVEYLKEMEARLFGLSTLELRSLAYQLAVKNDKYKLGPDRIYSCDETGISSVSKTKSKIISRRGRKQVGSLSSAERGQTVTVEICVSAAGSYMPPMLIFPRKRMKAQLLNNSARGTTSHCNASGWMTTDVFVSWFKSFIQFSRASKDNPVLLLLDGHATHTKNIELIDVARENGVVIICFPPHCTHRLQPLDVSFMKPLSVYYDQAAIAWLRSNPACIQAAIMSTAINGFRKCGIWPFNPENFTDADFLAAETTNINLMGMSKFLNHMLVQIQLFFLLPSAKIKNIQTNISNNDIPSTSFHQLSQPYVLINEVLPEVVHLLAIRPI